MTSKNISFKRFGEHAILVVWKNEIKREILEDIILLKDKIKKRDLKQIVDLKVAFNSLLIVYDSIIKNFSSEIVSIEEIYNETNKPLKLQSRLWKIPVCYTSEFASDLKAFSDAKGLSPKEVVELHTAHPYTVYFIGFLPGFLYLGGLDERLHLPRKATPELKVPKGAVAIGGNQTGVYPNESPGGWHVIGNTPIRFFDLSAQSPCFAKSGDAVLFYEVSKTKYEQIRAQVKAGKYDLESEVFYG